MGLRYLLHANSVDAYRFLMPVEIPRLRITAAPSGLVNYVLWTKWDNLIGKLPVPEGDSRNNLVIRWFELVE